jgi:hypothetical protein
MVQGRGRLSLSLEAGQRLCVSGYFIGKKLHVDKSVQGYVFGLVDDTHPAAAQLLNDVVMGNRSPGKWGRIGHSRECYSAFSLKST